MPHPPELPAEEVEQIVKTWRETLSEKSDSPAGPLSGILKFLRRTRLGYEIGGKSLALKSIDFLREVALSGEDRFLPEEIVEVLCCDYALFGNPPVAKALTQALSEVALHSKPSSSWPISHFVMDLLVVSHFMKGLEISPVVEMFQKLIENTDRSSFAQIPPVFRKFGLNHPDPNVVRISQEILEKMEGQGMPSIPRSELVLEENPFFIFISKPYSSPSRKNSRPGDRF